MLYDAETREEDIVEVCNDLLGATGRNFILILDPPVGIKQLVDWAWERMVDGEQLPTLPQSDGISCS